VAFDDDIALRPLGDGRYAGEIVEHWWTPRGPLGGYVMALMLHGAMLEVGEEERAPRTLTIHFLRPPAAGPVTVVARTERAGRSLSTVSVVLEQDGARLGIGLAALSRAWPGERFDDAPMPRVAPADPAVGLDAGLPDHRSPPFSERLTMQRRFGDDFFSRSEHGVTGGWVGLREQRAVDAPVVAMLADAWFPAPWPRLEKLMPAPTIEMTVYFRAPLPLGARGPLLGRFHADVVRDGFFDESGELWSPDGTLVAQSRQLGLLLEP
jgi:acyl-CoA thioesterase